MLKNTIIKSLILLFLLSQFATVVHALEHDLVHDDNELCFVCLHHSNVDNALSVPSNIVDVVLPGFERTPHHNQSIYLATLLSLKNRSPPITFK